MIRQLITAAAVVALTGCSVALTKEGRRVSIIENSPDLVEQCEFRGVIDHTHYSGWNPDDNVTQAKNLARNEAAAIGADTINIVSYYWRGVQADAFDCRGRNAKQTAKKAPAPVPPKKAVDIGKWQFSHDGKSMFLMSEGRPAGFPDVAVMQFHMDRGIYFIYTQECKWKELQEETREVEMNWIKFGASCLSEKSRVYSPISTAGAEKLFELASTYHAIRFQRAVFRSTPKQFLAAFDELDRRYKATENAL